MDMVEVLGVSKVQRMRGELTQEKAQIAQSAWDAGVSLIGVGLPIIRDISLEDPFPLFVDDREVNVLCMEIDPTVQSHEAPPD
jgi:hypothetical protein